MKVYEIWQILQSDQSEIVSGYLTRLIFPDLNYDVYLAIEKPNNDRLLMLRVKQTSININHIFPTSNCFEVRKVVMPNDKDSYITLQLILTNTQYEDIFTTLVQDILDQISIVFDEHTAILKFCSRLEKWQKFLEKNNYQGLSLESQQGLYGELWLLREIIIPKLGFYKAISSWSGPESSPQDFELDSCVIEVKTTSSRKTEKILISSEKQLEDQNNRKIILVLLHLDLVKQEGESLPKIVNSIKEILSGSVILEEKFLQLLFKVGYFKIHEPMYATIQYSVKNHDYFKVEGDFPRILESQLPIGIDHVKYNISISKCRDFLIPLSEVFLLLDKN